MLMLLIAVLTGTTMAVVGALAYRQQTPPPDSGKAGEAQWPVADYTAGPPADPEERAKRRSKGSRYDRPGSQPIQESHERYERSWTGHWWKDIPAVPAAQSNAVVLGEIADARAYLSNDKSVVYSEFTVRVEEVLKSDATGPLALGDMVSALRFGGAVRFPSGKVQVYRVRGQGAPRTGHRYVLFLKTESEGGFSILTGYEVRGERIVPLDGECLKGGEVTPFDRFEGFEAATFLTLVREAVAKSQQNAAEAGREN